MKEGEETHNLLHKKFIKPLIKIRFLEIRKFHYQELIKSKMRQLSEETANSKSHVKYNIKVNELIKAEQILF